MRAFIYGVWFIVVTGMLSGCGSNTDTKPAASATPPSAAPQAENAADTKDFVMQSGGANVLKLTAPGGTKCVAEDGELKFDAPKFYVEVWLASGAKSVEEAVENVSSQIVSEFKNFKPDQTTELTIARSPAKRMVGVGEEADDGDPGKADVIVFKVGERVFVACNHGESLNDAGQQGLLTLVQTAQMP
ncbi:MAG TPA: hypothetical protein VMJ32_08090 [Pirellulales bacterium]|nr:hypothetical protein [Pirellulales bacterium]